MRAKLRRDDLIFPELSYKIIGCAYEVHNAIGFGFKEKVYQDALSLAFSDKGLKIQEQLFFEVKFKGKVIAKRYFDFLVEEQVVVEIKRHEKYSKANIDQTIDYLKTSKLKLGILINFGREGVDYKRLINPGKL